MVNLTFRWPSVLKTSLDKDITFDGAHRV